MELAPRFSAGSFYFFKEKGSLYMNKHRLERELGYSLENHSEFSGEIPEETFTRGLEPEELEVMMKWRRN